nr:bifunctional alpha/beta hydrolase/OsmC family protein [Kibdelosporangium sp. MJ126-NF4]CEL17342.1 Bll2902 protein [Kibdelosporangium sp. MJ126-NF4]CTQ91430.1 Bll2902 protein [Kibdelosporangium sp. MJ126-NF4]
MQSRKIEFTGSQGETLTARLELPEGDIRTYALFAHCFTCGQDAIAAARIARALTEYGIAVLRFDFTGPGGSDGDFGNTNVDDLVHAADYLRVNHGPATVLVGHSLGGSAVLAAAHRLPEVRAVATIGAQFREDIAERLARLKAALLVLHSPVDEHVGIDNARRIFGAAHHPKSFVALDGADHLLTDREDAEYVASVLGTWATRYAIKRALPPEGTVMVAENGDGSYGQRITAGRHTITADEPVPVGNDSGPTPYDLLLAALGACTSMTLRMYADRKQIPLKHVTVHLHHSRVHAKDCEDCETKTGMVDLIERTIHLVGDLDDDQRQRLLQIADKCPVHRTLQSEIAIRTTL